MGRVAIATMERTKLCPITRQVHLYKGLRIGRNVYITVQPANYRGHVGMSALCSGPIRIT